MSNSIFFLVLFSVLITIQAARITSKVTKAFYNYKRPEAPLLYECDRGEEIDKKGSACFVYDPANLENWSIFLRKVEAWEISNPRAAKKFYLRNPNLKKKEISILTELKKLAAQYEYF